MATQTAGKVTETAKGAVRSSTAAATTAMTTLVLALLEDVVLALLHGLGREDIGELVTFGVLLCPLSDGFEHVAMNLKAFVAGSRVVESADDIVDDLVDWNTSILPSIENATK